MEYVIGAKNAHGDVSMTRPVKINAEKPTKGTLRTAKRIALHQWRALGYDTREEDVVVLRLYR